MIDLVVLDLGLPDAQGVESVESLIPYLGGTPVIVLTGNRTENVGNTCRRRWRRRLLPKSGADDLLRLVEFALRRHNLLNRRFEALSKVLLGATSSEAAGQADVLMLRQLQEIERALLVPAERDVAARRVRSLAGRLVEFRLAPALLLERAMSSQSTVSGSSAGALLLVAVELGQAYFEQLRRPGPETEQEQESRNADERPRILRSQSALPTHIVGLGASAGGLESLERFFDAFPSDTGMALVVIQHLAPDHKSLMSELLSKHTQMPVRPATHGAHVEPNHVYLIPPGHNVEVRDCRLVLTQRMDHPHRRPNYAIDQFFRSLALDFAERSVAVVMSGTGSDGSHGASAINAAGGVVFAEAPESAKFDSMPRAAIETGTVAAIRSASALPAEILRHVGLLDAEVVQPKEGLAKILSLMGEHTGIAFETYKPSTVGRRIDRRRITTECSSLDDYASLLERSSEERTELGRDLLVGVTAFFRDREVFEALPARLEPLVREAAERRDRTLRMWVAACSTGEEAYSMAIACHEVIRELGLDVTVKMFATDVNEESLVKAGRGRYPFSASAEITPELMQRYFSAQPDAYEALPFLRETIVFARHDILRDPPFTRIDVLSCRNMLIYFAADAQRRAKNVFQFALRHGGLLFLGSSETLGPEERGFTVLDEHCRFYEMNGAPLPAHSLASDIHPADRYVERRFGKTPTRTPIPLVPLEPGIRLLEATLERMAYPVLILNAAGRLAYAFGGAAQHLRVPTGRSEWLATELLPEGLDLVVSSAVEQAMGDDQEVVIEDVPFEEEGNSHRVTVRAVPLGVKSNPDRGTAVFLGGTSALGVLGSSTVTTEKGVAQLSVGEAVQSRVLQLEEELRRTKAKLMTTVEELEASNEELQATNEELVSSNEELQSTNEELQSLNEELHTVNAELQAKVEELSILSADLGNLLRTMGAGLLFLDTEGKIRRYNDHVLDVIPLVPHDIGRSIGDIAHRMEHVDLGADVRRVVQTGVGAEREVTATNGRVYSLTLHPFSNHADEVEGTVVTLNDVTKLHSARERLQVYSRLVEQSPSLSVIADAFGNIEYANPAYSTATGLRPAELRGRDIRTTLAERTSSEAGEAIREALDMGTPWTGEIWLKTSSMRPLRVKTSLYPVKKKDGTVSHLVKIGEAQLD